MATLGETAVGSSVYLNVNGVRTEFLVVHQGLPDTTLYDSSCDGTWLLMKDAYTSMLWGGTNNDYQNSDVHTYLNGTFFGLLDGNIQNTIKQVKIPYRNGTGSGGTTATGANGLSTKIFLLSGYEVGWTTSNNTNFPVDGACLSYFSGCAAKDSKRIAYYNGAAVHWMIRSPYTYNKSYIWCVTNAGYFVYANYNAGAAGSSTTPDSVRPALILDSSVNISDDGDIITNTSPTTPSGITTPTSIGYGSDILVSWGASTDADGDAITYIVERTIDNGASWNQVYQGSNTSVSDTFGVEVAYRVKAVDSNGAESEYAISNAVELEKGGSGGIYVRQNGVWKPAEAIKIITGGA